MLGGHWPRQKSEDKKRREERLLAFCCLIYCLGMGGNIFWRSTVASGLLNLTTYTYLTLTVKSKVVECLFLSAQAEFHVWRDSSIDIIERHGMV